KQALPRAHMDLSQPLVGRYVQSDALGQHLRGLIAPRQITGVDPRWPIRSQDFGRLDRLRIANLIERNVGLTLIAVDHIPLGATVTPNDDPCSRPRRSSTRGSISGQSRHSRSNA